MKIHFPTTNAASAAPLSGAASQPSQKVRLFSIGGTGSAGTSVTTISANDEALVTASFAAAAATDPKVANTGLQQFYADSAEFFAKSKYDSDEIGHFMDHLHAVQQGKSIGTTPDAFDNHVAQQVSVSPVLIAAARRRIQKMPKAARDAFVKGLVGFSCSLVGDDAADSAVLSGFNRERIELANRKPKSALTLDERVRDNTDRIDALENKP